MNAAARDVLWSAENVLDDESTAVPARLTAKPFGKSTALSAEIHDIVFVEGSMYRLVRRDLASAVGLFALDWCV
jgi:hypothetical protein